MNSHRIKLTEKEWNGMHKYYNMSPIFITGSKEAKQDEETSTKAFHINSAAPIND